MFGITLATHWWWLVLAVVLGIAEIVAPGFFLIWIGAAALVTGLLSLLLGLPPAAEFAIFAVATVIAVYAARRWFSLNPIISADPLLNDRTARMIGKVVTVVEAIDGGNGRVKVDDGVWNATGPALAVGRRARIVGADGSLLRVEPVDG